MAKRPVKKSPAKGAVKPTKKSAPKVVSEFGKHQCVHKGCKNPTCMMRRDRKTGKELHYCGTHWKTDYERVSPEFKAQVAKFNKEQAERVAKNAKPKKKIVKKTTKKAVKK